MNDEWLAAACADIVDVPDSSLDTAVVALRAVATWKDQLPVSFAPFEMPFEDVPESEDMFIAEGGWQEPSTVPPTSIVRLQCGFIVRPNATTRREARIASNAIHIPFCAPIHTAYLTAPKKISK